MHTAILLLTQRLDDLCRVWSSASPPIEPGAETATLLFDQITVSAELSGKTTDPQLLAAASGRPGVVVMRVLSHSSTVTVRADTAAALEKALGSVGPVGAGLVWWPENGAMEPLGQRQVARESTSVAPSPTVPYDPLRSSEAMYLLLEEEPTSLGEVLSDFMPNHAAKLQQDQALSTVVPFTDPDARIALKVVGPIDDESLAARAGGEMPAHGAAVEIDATGSAGVDDLVMYQVSFAAELARRPEAAGVWIPWQERFEPAGTILGEDPEKLVQVAVHAGRAEDMDVLYTRGMRRYRGRELVCQDPGPQYPIAQLLLLICSDAISSGQLPQPGGRADSGLAGFDALFHDITDPWSGEPALNLELVEQGSGS